MFVNIFYNILLATLHPVNYCKFLSHFKDLNKQMWIQIIYYQLIFSVGCIKIQQVFYWFKSQVNLYLIWISFIKWWEKNRSEIVVSHQSKLFLISHRHSAYLPIWNSAPFIHFLAFIRCRTLFLFLLQLLLSVSLLFCTDIKRKLLYEALMRWKQPYGSSVFFTGNIHFIDFTRAQYTSSTPSISALTSKLPNSIYRQTA